MRTFSDWAIVVIIGLLGGAAVGFQGPMGGAISQRVGPLAGSLIVHTGGAVLSGVLLLFITGGDWNELNALPKPYLLAGCLGVIVLASVAYTLPRVGAVTSVMLLIAAQLSVSVVIDHFGWLNAPVHPLTVARAAGLGLVIIGAYLTTQ